mgnify:FL=1
MKRLLLRKAWLDSMKRLSAWEAWKLLMLSLPKGIGGFLFAVAGLAVGIAASAIVIGIPLLAFVLIVCRRMLESERGLTAAWKNGKKAAAGPTRVGEEGPVRERRGLGGLLAVFTDGRSYRGVAYGLLQLPAGAVFFTLALAAPLTVLALLLAPGIWLVVEAKFDYVLFADGWLFVVLTRMFGFTPFEQSWIVGGCGLLLALLVAAAIRMLGRFYAAWIEGVAGVGPEAAIVPASQVPLAETPAFASEDSGPEVSPLRLEPESLEQRLDAGALRT